MEDLGDRAFDCGQFAMAIEVMQDGVLVYDEAARIVMVNDRFLAATDYAREELIGQPALNVMPAHLREELRPRMAAYLRNPVAVAFDEGLEGSIARKDGSTFKAQLANTPIRSNQGLRIVIAIRDVANLSLDEIRFRGLLEAAPDATLILNDETRVVLSNSRAERLFGRDHVHMFDQPLHRLFPDRHVGMLTELLRTSHAAFLAGGPEYQPTPTVELDAVREDGSLVPVELSIASLRTSQALLLRIAVRDISERHRLQTEADRVKDRFLATISHELRTPLTSVLGYAEMLQDLGPEHVSADARRFLGVIIRNAQREVRLVDDLLTLVSAGEEGLSIRMARIDLHKVVLEAVEAARPAAQDAGLRISFSNHGDGAHVRGDADRLGQAVDNLISNAVKFSRPGDEVNVCLQGNANSVILTIKDSGPGIPATEVHRVFERHFRGQHAVAAEAPGAGLGLPVVKSIVEAHKGTVDLECPPMGGTRVHVSLPLAPSTVRPDALSV